MSRKHRMKTPRTLAERAQFAADTSPSPPPRFANLRGTRLGDMTA